LGINIIIMNGNELYINRAKWNSSIFSTIQHTYIDGDENKPHWEVVRCNVNFPKRYQQLSSYGSIDDRLKMYE
jgi:hypothetical protein